MMNVVFILGELQFEWDSVKAASNLGKHGLSFEDGATVFLDAEGLLLDDPDLFEDELRLELLGYSASSRMLVIVHVERGLRLRIVSVRAATKDERRFYEKRKG